MGECLKQTLPRNIYIYIYIPYIGTSFVSLCFSLVGKISKAKKQTKRELLLMDANTLAIHRQGVDFLVNSTPYFQEFWDGIQSWEIETFQIFNRFLNNKYSYLDIGAWIGPTVLYGAHKAKNVFAIEPDPVAYQELIKNIQLNPRISSKVTCINAAIVDRPGHIKLYKRDELGDSMSSILPTRTDEDYFEVIATSIEELTLNYNLKDLNFIKMDIEAGEYFLIPALKEFLKKNRPTLYLSLHPPFLHEALNLRLSKNTNSKMDANSPDIVSLTENLVNNLDFYKFIYDPQGNLVNKDTILNLKNLGMFLFTDEQW